MKCTNTFTYFLLSILCLYFCSSCSDDENNNDNNSITTFEKSCCNTPHLEACIGGAKVYISNVFTPNGDGTNDLFYVSSGSGINRIEQFTISDQDGTPVFEKFSFFANNPDQGWDGRLPDGSLPNGVYNYQIIISNAAGLSETLEGQVCARTGDLTCVDKEQHCAYGLQHDGTGGFNPDFATGETCQ